MSSTASPPSRFQTITAFAGLAFGLTFGPVLLLLYVFGPGDDTIAIRTRRLAEQWTVGLAAVLVYLQFLRGLGALVRGIVAYYRPPAPTTEVLPTAEPKPIIESEKVEPPLEAPTSASEAEVPTTTPVQPFGYEGHAVPGDLLITGYHIYLTRPLLVTFVSALVITWGLLRGTPSSMTASKGFNFILGGFGLAYWTLVCLASLRLATMAVKMRWRNYRSRGDGRAASV
ncbi:hypothetical protein HMN09_00134500 [Mycena chlorophos]|uniref:Uncharacterized protein n=1 Tax=Mycena chlorophos TaxID=658473 RepID=A0A8H6WMT9_MYCCL|nr:hypothetical protein HMN09_00134500 [Mycena chlorophos]